MRIAFVLGEFPVLSETFILSQITGLLDRGHDVEIFANRPASIDKTHPDVERYDLIDKAHYWPTGASAPKGLRDLAQSARRGAKMAARALSATDGPEERSAKLVRRAASLDGPRRFDAIISHFGHVARETQMLRDLGALQGKLVTIFHAYDVTVFLREQGTDVYEHLFETGELFLPISEHWQNRLIELGCPAERTFVHHMGIDCSKFEFRPRRLDDGPVRLMSVARFVEKKGLYYATRALAKLAETHANVEYNLVGDGPLRPKLEALVDELGVREQVRFLGWQTHDQVAELLDEMHLLVVPSVTALNGDTEGIPMVLMEAMARGLPVVSTYHSGIPELVDDGVNGALVPERDIRGLADKLAWLVDNPDQWEDLGRAGRAKVEEEFNVDKLNDMLVERLQAMLTASTNFPAR